MPAESYVFGGNSNPTVTLNYPGDGANLIDVIDFNCTATVGSCTAELANITLYHNASGNWAANATNNVGGTTNTTEFSKTISDGSYIWNCLASDDESNTAFASANYTFNIDKTSPYYNTSDWIANGANKSQTAFYFNVTWKDNSGLDSWIISENQTGSWANHSQSTGWISKGNGWWTAVMNFTISAVKNTAISVIGYANDTSGNWNWTTLNTGYGINVTINVLNTAPTTPTVYYPVDGGNYTLIPYMNYSSTDADGDAITYKVYINGSLNASTTVNLSLWNASYGYYNLTVSAYDGTESSANSSIISFGYYECLSDTDCSSGYTCVNSVCSDITPPGINFTSPTPSNGSSQSQTYFEVNVSITESSLDSVVYDWNGTNYTMYNDSLVLMMNFDNVSSLGEGAAKTVDVSKYGNNGTITNALVNDSNCKYGKCLSFDGNGDYIEIPNIVLTKYMSVGVWVKFLDTGSQMIVAADDEGSHPANRQHFLGSLNSDPTKIRWVIFNTAQQWTNQAGRILVDPSAYSTNTWYYYVGTWDGTNAKLYRDGVQVASVSFTGTLQSTTTTTRIGGNVQEESVVLYTKGNIDEVRVWNRSLSKDEIYQQYASNLNKYDINKWALYVNQSLNATDGLGDEAYTYQGYAADSLGNWNSTEERTISVDAVAPAFSGNKTNASADTYNGTDVQINLTITDSVGVAWYRLTTNDTSDGSWANESLISASGTSVYVIFNYTIHNFTTSGGVLGWKVWANDSAGNVNVSSVYTLVVQDNSPDTTPPAIEFVDPTSADGVNISETYFEVNVSISESSLDSVVYDWNGTNYTYYNDSLVLMYNFDNVSSLGDSNSKVVDLKSGINGSFVNNVIYNSSGKYGLSVQFDGADDIINLGNSAYLRPPIFTISAWVYPTAGTGSETNYITRWDSAVAVNQRCYVLGKHTDETLQFRVSDSGSGDGHVAYSTNSISLNTWTYVTGIFNGTHLLTYINGNADGTPVAHTGLHASTNPTVLGAISGRVGTDPIVTDFKGMIDEVRIWNRSLSADEVYQQYASNLNKYNSTQWYLYVNQSLNASDGLMDGDYIYRAYAADSSGNWNSTEERTITVDTFAPAFSGNATNASSETYNGTDVQINLTITDSVGVAWYRLTTNDTSDGSWANESLISASGTSVYAIFNYTIHNFTTAGGTLGWRVWANDSIGNVNISSVYTLVVQDNSPDTTPPQINFTSPTPANGTSQTETYFEVNVSITEASLDSVIYDWNGTNFTYYNDSLLLM
ncbi:hypothetical protein KKA13_04905, partial [Patescibacteria group bacterium]|nr:hypothetical protein [Patescibacteria group bacterium]